MHPWMSGAEAYRRLVAGELPLPAAQVELSLTRLSGVDSPERLMAALAQGARAAP